MSLLKRIESKGNVQTAPLPELTDETSPANGHGAPCGPGPGMGVAFVCSEAIKPETNHAAPPG